MVEQWVKKAEEDYALSLFLKKPRKKQLLDHICFHSRESAERYLRAFLAKHSIELERKSYALEFLLDRCIALNQEFQLCRPYTEILEPYTLSICYPGRDATTEEAQNTIVAIRKMRRIVRRIMGL